MNKTKKITLYAILTAILIISKEVLAFLPNVELVTFLLMMYALYLDFIGITLISIVFCFVQMALYGTGMWTISYFMIWPLYGWITIWLRHYLKGHYVRMAIVSLLFGLCFGFLTAIPYFMISISAGWSYFLRGLMFDLIHGVGNFIIMIILYDSIAPVMERLFKTYII